MEPNYQELINKFKEISRMRWVKGINNNTNSVGLTFENLLGKKLDTDFFPDYKGIEIKCSQRYSRFPIKLFSLAFDGPSFYEMNEIVKKYGETDYKYKDKKLINIHLTMNKKISYNNKNYFELKISIEEQKLYLIIYKWKGLVVDRISYINLSTIKNHLEIKLSSLAVVWASKKQIEESLYFRYYKICIYKLISFDKFLELIKSGKISISIEGHITSKGIEQGRLRNQNVIFRMPKENIEELFSLQKIYDIDKKS